jgi:hypothetical protein
MRMIQGLHASSMVFADFTTVSGVLLANLSRRLPGIDAAGYPVRLHGAEYRLRLGPLHREKRALVARLDLESKGAPFQSQLTGTVKLLKVPVQSRTKVIFEGRCARNFGSLSSTASTDAVRHHANDSSRTILDLLVTAFEGPAAVPADGTAIASSTVGQAATTGAKPRTKTSDRISKGGH